jgi:hypothetical protein
MTYAVSSKARNDTTSLTLPVFHENRAFSVKVVHGFLIKLRISLDREHMYSPIPPSPHRNAHCRRRIAPTSGIENRELSEVYKGVGFP